MSNIDRDDLDAAVRYHQLRFDHVVTSEDVRSYKPRPEMFDRALALVGVSRDAVLHVGDSWSNDVAGASSVGIPVAWVNRAGRPRPQDLSLHAEVADLVALGDLLQYPG